MRYLLGTQKVKEKQLCILSPFRLRINPCRKELAPTGANSLSSVKTLRKLLEKSKLKLKIFRNLIYAHNVQSRKENPQKLTKLSSRSHPRPLVGKRTAQKDTIIVITSDSQVNSNFPYRWSPASLTFNNYFFPIFIFIYNVNNHR